MNSDATEAALGLLGLSPLNAPQSHPHPQPQLHPYHHVAHPHGPSLTSSSVGIAVDRTSATPVIQSAFPPSLVPLKRKQPSPALSSATATPLTPNFSRELSTKSPHPLATSSTPPIHPNRPLPGLSTKSLTAPQQHPFSPVLSGPVPPQTPPTSQLPLTSPSTSQHPLSLSDVPPPPDADAISCICGFSYDDGFSIACDDCSRWCHAACFGIVQGGEVPEFWKCWVCDPTLEVDKERAVKIQKGRVKAMRMKASHGANGVPGITGINGSGASSAPDEGSAGVGKPTSRRKTSPGAERKSRRGSAVAAAIEGSGSSRKKRRASMLSPTNPSSPSIPSTNHPSSQPHAGGTRVFHPNGSGPAASTSLPPIPVTFPPDIYPNPAVYTQLLRVAKAWRGVTALNPPSPFIQPPPKTYSDGAYTRVHSQGYQDCYGYSMSPLDNTTPVIMDEHAGDIFVPRTVLRTDPTVPCSNPHSGLNSQYPSAPPLCTPAHLRPPSPRLHVASNPSPFSHTSIYPSPPISNYTSTPVPSSSHPRSSAKSPLTPSTNTISSYNSNDTIPAATLLAPYTTAIVPSATYLADPLNGYAHLGMGKPQVRLVGGGWEVGLDSRGVTGVPAPSDSGDKGDGSVKEDVVDDKARWAKCGCWPNAVVRPVICSGKKRGNGRKRNGVRHRAECAQSAFDGSAIFEGGGPSSTENSTSIPPAISPTQGQQTDDSSDQDDTPSTSDSDADPTALSFALFALRDLRADEEIVLGWEWDDGHAVHMLPALMESPGLFAPAHLHHLRAQFTSILHALSSTFTTCACGSSTRDCAVRLMERVVEGRWPWPGAEMTSEGSEGDTSDVNGASEEWDDGEADVDVEGDGNSDPRASQNLGLGMNVDVDVDIEMDTPNDIDVRNRRVKKRKVRKKSQAEGPIQVNGDQNASGAASSSTPRPRTKKAVDLGPLVGVKRGFRTREKEPMNGGWGGVEIVPSSLTTFPGVSEEDSHVGGKGKGKARMVDGREDSDVGPSLTTLPPRMRKSWSRSPAGQLEPSTNDQLRAHLPQSESGRKQERWRSPLDTNAESPMSVSGAMEGSSNGGEGGAREESTSIVNGDREEGADGQETEFDTETETDGLDDTRQMPPPPMPASLDPTTVSSLAHAHTVRSASPRGSLQRDKNGAAAIPQTPTSASASSSQSSQPPGQGTSSVTAAPPIARSPLASQINHGAPSPLTSLPAAMQGQALSHPSLLSTVSPSTTFSKLSLHSPDASLPHLSVLCSPNESTPLPSTSAFRASDNQALSPIYKPSKPLHVHPLNEHPSLPTSLPPSVAALNSLDSIRDTPAEAQYQQTYRPSPESRYDTKPPSDGEKRRPSNGEVYRVRFASPEILGDIPRLKGSVTSDSSEPVDVHDGVSANANAIGLAKAQEATPMDHDATNVELDVVGDSRVEDGGGTSHAMLPESKMDQVLEDERSSIQAPHSPHLPAPPESPPSYNTVSVDDGAAPGNDSSQTASDANEAASQAEPMAVDPTPAREPSPPPPPKVKMSLKDFALRKKKQREEEMAAKALSSPVTPDGPALPPSPSVEVKQELASGHAGAFQNAGSAEIVNGQDVKMTDATADAPQCSGTLDISANGFEGESGHGRDATRGPRRTEEKATAEEIKLPAGIQAPSMMTKTKDPDTLRSQPTLSLANSSHLLGERNNLHQAQSQTQIDAKPPTTLATKMEIMDVMMPSGLVGADDPPPDVVSFAPEPPPPPLTTEQTSEMTTVDRSVPLSSRSRLAPSSAPASASTATSMSTSTSTSVVNSRSNSVGISGSTPTSLPHAHAPSSSSNLSSSRRPSHEDGEITSSTPPKTYLPRSHTPPTQPRSFNAAHPPSPNLGPTNTSSSTASVSRRPAPPLSRSPLTNNAGPTPPPISSRPLPSGPRALRGSMTQSTHPYAPPPRPPYAGSQYIPRGPSADRDRGDWDRGDRQWPTQARSRGRAGSNGWGR